MRIERLDLVAFGNFTGTVVDLSAPGLQVLYGPNETGKTTARAAVVNLLFDFDLRTPYAFVHPMSKLQLGARLRGEDGSTLEVTRFKRNKEPLVEAASGRPVAPASWAGLLQGVSRTDFEARYTLGWEELVRGTSELVAQGGLLGETLFAAGLGVKALGPVLERLDAEAAALYAPRASTRTANAALKDHAEARRRVGELSAKPAHHAELVKQHEQAEARLAEVVARRRAAEGEHERLVTLRGVLPVLRERATKGEERARLLAEGSPPPASWAGRVHQALDARSEATRVRASAAAQLRVLGDKLAGMTADEALLALAEGVDALSEKVAAYLEGRMDRGGLEEGRRDDERAALQIVGSLAGGEASAAGLGVARSVLAGRSSFAPAHQDWTARAQARRHAADQLARLEQERSEIESTGGPVAEVPDVSSLEEALAAAAREGDLDQALASARTALEGAGRARAELAGRLGLSGDEIAQVLSRPAPSAEELEGILSHLADAEAAGRAAEERADGDVQRADELSGQLALLALEGELPGEDELGERRAAREAAWSLVRASWLDRAAVTGDGTPFADERALAASFERAGADADAVADRLWQEADRTARRRALTLERDRARDAAERSRAVAGRSREEAAAAYGAWRGAWPAQRLPERPASLRQWAGDLERLRALEEAWAASRRAHRGAFRSLRAHRGRLASLLAVHGVEALPGSDLLPVVDRARAFLEVRAQARAARAEAEASLRRIERLLPRQRAALEEATAAEEHAGTVLAGLLGPYGAGLASPEEAGLVLGRLDELERLLVAHDGRVRRIEGIDARAAAFEGELASLLVAAPDLAGEPVADAARALVRRLAAARELDAARQALVETRAGAEAALEGADARLAGLRDELALLADEGGVADPELVEAWAARSVRLDEVDGDLARCEELLAAQGGGRSSGELEADGEGRDLADVNAAISACKARLEAAEADEQEAFRATQALARELEAMDGSDAAALEAGRAEEALGRAGEAAGRYARVVLARLLADEAIRRYREAHQDPLLKRASHYLARLTGGRFEQVAVDGDQRRGPRLGAVAPNGEERGIPELSEGTRDQLYLALRLAALEEAFARSGPMPVVLDDVLVNFDDERAGAALACLAELAGTGQVLLFTHHRHLVALAETVLAPSARAMHDLGALGG